MLRRTFIETNGFRFKHVEDVYDVGFLPGAVKYGDLPGILALAAPIELRVDGESEDSISIVRAAYRAEGRPHHLQLDRDNLSSTISWLLNEH